MTVTFTLASGNKVRTATKSRFVLIGESDRGAWIEKRSSSIDTLAKHRRRRGFRADTRFVLGDTVTGEVRGI